jgi:hypothetical protein
VIGEFELGIYSPRQFGDHPLPRLAPVGGSVQIGPGATLHNQYPRRRKMRPILVDNPVLPWYDIASTIHLTPPDGSLSIATGQHSVYVLER